MLGGKHGLIRGQAGTSEKAIAIQAFQAELTNEYKDMYDIYYRVHVPYRGWLGWAKNGEIAGSIGLALRTEAIQIKLVIKGSQISTEGLPSLTKPTLTYSSHVQDMGWRVMQMKVRWQELLIKKREWKQLKLN